MKIKRISTSEARVIITQLDRMDLERADFEWIKILIKKLFRGVVAFPVDADQNAPRLYRGVIYKELPEFSSQLSYPPGERVCDFQRCNRPFYPMFYCSVDPTSPYYELEVKPGDKIYLSKWSVVENFLVFRIEPVKYGIDDRVTNLIFDYIRARFLQPIHKTCSRQYKVTAAIAEFMSEGDLFCEPVITLGAKSGGGTLTAEYDGFAGPAVPAGKKNGGVSYWSVSDPNKSQNLAIRPKIVDECMRLDYVEEMLITSRVGNKIDFMRTNFSSKFKDGKIIWSGRLGQWIPPPNSQYVANITPYGCVVRDHNGNIVDPG